MRDGNSFHSCLQGHSAVTDVNTRTRGFKEVRLQGPAGHVGPQTLRASERSTVERVNGLLKYVCGDRHIRGARSREGAGTSHA